MSDLYNRIESLCQSKNISITTMCKESGVSRASLSDLKAGRKQGLSSETLSKIAIFLNVSVDYLLTGYPAKITIGRKITQSISHNIQHHREEAKLSQRQFADILGVDESFVVGLESGQITLDREMLYRICDALRLIPGNFIPRDDEELTEDEEYLLSRRGKKSPDQLLLTEGEEMLLNLFRQVPADQQELVLQMIRAALGTQR